MDRCAPLILLASSFFASPVSAGPAADPPAGRLPERLEIAVERGGETVVLDLDRRSLRAAGFRVRAWTREGGYRTVAAPAPATYSGVVRGRAGSVVGASLLADGLHATVFPPDGMAWSVRPRADGGLEVLDAVLFDAPDRGGVEPPPGAADPGGGGMRPKSHPCDLFLTEIAFDVDNPYFVNLGGVLADVVANVEGHLAAVDAHHARDAQITYRLTEIVIREDPFYFPTDESNLLVQFRDEWRANQGAVQRDIAHLMTGQPAPGLAGLAYVAVTCSQDWAYGWSVDSSGVLSHEIGHNWGSGHCHDVSPCNNMCGACLLIGPNTKDIITAFRDSRTCLDLVGGFANPLPPYAHPDRLDVTREELVARAELPVDVLENDHDGNCDEMELVDFDATSALGGRVRRSEGTGSFEHDELLYTPPCTVFVGEDRFAYVLGDESGETVVGEVTVDLIDRTLAAWWPMDDGAGDVAAELARGGAATLAGTPAWGAGPRDGALVFDGVDDSATIGPLNLPRPEATFAAWVRPDGAQAPWAGLVFTREAGSTAGLNLADDGSELRYHWQGANWDWSSGLSLPADAWSFIALVVEPTQATLWIDDGTGLVSSTHAVDHGLQAWAGEGRLGEDPSGGRLFRGALDDVRVFDHALAREQLEALVLTGGDNAAPSPPDGAATPEARPTLRWVAPSDAEEHDVYLGADHVAVRDATTETAGVYRGRQAGTEWTVPDLLLPGRAHAWRVDVVRGGVPRPGRTWIFRSDGASPRLHAHWSFDDGAELGADSGGRGLDGMPVGGASGAAGRWSGAVQLDGADDTIVLPDIDAPDLPLSITAWVRRDGDQDPWAGLLFSRDGGAAGFNFGNANELRYHWQGGRWQWDSGIVVPEATWTLVALVVEPDRATIWMHDGTLVSATNADRHERERFTGTVRIGLDPNGGPRFFRGLMDDVRVWDGALQADDLEALWLSGGPATNPSPADGEELAAAPALLSWTPRPDATQREVYFGESLDAVSAAGPGDPEHAGTLTGTELPLSIALPPGAVRYWRVDETTPGGPARGPVWRFATVERIGDGLRVFRTLAGDPDLRWPDAGRGREYEVQRCEPAPGDSCAPAAVDVVGPYRGDWADAGAGARPLLWYRVVETGPCAP